MKTRRYEMLTLFSFREDVYQQDLEKVKQILSDTHSEIVKENKVGVKDLAYPVKKQTKGLYHLIYFDTETPNLKKIRDELKLNESILRYLIIEVRKKDFDYLEKKEEEDKKKAIEEKKKKEAEALEAQQQDYQTPNADGDSDIPTEKTETSQSSSEENAQKETPQEESEQKAT